MWLLVWGATVLGCAVWRMERCVGVYGTAQGTEDSQQRYWLLASEEAWSNCRFRGSDRSAAAW